MIVAVNSRATDYRAKRQKIQKKTEYADNMQKRKKNTAVKR